MAIQTVGAWTLAGVEAGSIIGWFIPQVGIAAGVLGGATTGLVIGVTEKFFGQWISSNQSDRADIKKTDKTSDKLITAAKVTGGLAVGLCTVSITQCDSMSDSSFCCGTYLAGLAAIGLTEGLAIHSFFERKWEKR